MASLVGRSRLVLLVRELMKTEITEHYLSRSKGNSVRTHSILPQGVVIHQPIPKKTSKIDSLLYSVGFKSDLDTELKESMKESQN